MAYFEDVEIGTVQELGSHTFTKDEIIAFARKYDPQPFHLDEEAAEQSLFGGLVASGWHTAGTWMKLMVRYREALSAQARAEGRTEDEQPAGVSPGFFDMRWPEPVRPGDTITYTATTVEKVELKSRPDLGIVRSRNVGVNQDGKVVMSFIGQGMIPRRPKD